MEELIRQAFLHVEGLGPHIQQGHYDLLGPKGEIILPQVWEAVIEPDWLITMHMWPMPALEKSKTPPTAVVDRGRPRRAAAPTFGEADTDLENTVVPVIASRRILKESNGEQLTEKSTKLVGGGPPPQSPPKEKSIDLDYFFS
jgi:hypothetical protein